MSFLYVCSAAKARERAQQINAEALVSLISPPDRPERPSHLNQAQHLHLAIHDILVPTAGLVVPQGAHIEKLLDFARVWPQRRPMLIHCFAGVSRSSAAAYIIACFLRPQTSEAEFAEKIRAFSPTATPNIRLVSLADDVLQRRGRMVRAIEAIGRGAECAEGVPFSLLLEQDDISMKCHRALGQNLF